ncbi:OPT family oligopeptide transporter [candidate division CSSED10-310 bacterium]|uniref:OPT family oligopeptide transporter n=1 Tax=candidate division CSSED10-310 bacterium TaxID=2855610 RepID=A0ABV6Z215_UNCC1
MSQDPYIAPHQNIPEFTWQAILLGIILAIVLGAANCYLGLYAGMTVSASIPAAVISMGILRGILRRGNILENNMVQTLASTGESLAAGIIFTLPALVIAGVWSGFDFWTVTLVSLFGGILGIIFMIPMRKSLVVDEKMLKYPEGTACAEVLKAGEGERVGMGEIALGMITGAVLKFFISGVALFKGTIEAARRLSGSIFYFGSDISAALVGVGAIVGFNISILMFTGGAIGWLIGIPLLGYLEGVGPGKSLDVAWDLWGTKIRYIGVGSMIVAGIWSIVKIRHGIVSGFREVFKPYNKEEQKAALRTELNMSNRHIIAILAIVAISMFAFYLLTLKSIGLTIVSVILIFILSVFLVAVASYICGLVGSSNSPVSGMTICALLVTALVFYLMGVTGTFAILATLLVSGVICCATCTAGDISQDLKTGLLVGATPRKQQWGEIIGAVVASLFFAPILALLHNAYGIGTNAPGSLKAPQAALFASLAESIFGEKEMPWIMIGIGIVLAIVNVALDEILEKKKTNFRMYPMPVAVGIYLPFSLAIPIVAGGLIELVIRRRAPRQKKNAAPGMRNVILLASGLIAGEALMGILLALFIWCNEMFLWKIDLPINLTLSEGVITGLTIAAGGIIIAILARKGLHGNNQ